MGLGRFLSVGWQVVRAGRGVRSGRGIRPGKGVMSGTPGGVKAVRGLVVLTYQGFGHQIHTLVVRSGLWGLRQLVLN